MTSRAFRRPRASVAVLALALPLSTVLVGVTATPARAASSITAPGENVVFTSGSTVDVKADLDPCVGSTTLNVDGPDNAWRTTNNPPGVCTASTSPRRQAIIPNLNYAVRSDGTPRRNGPYKITLSGGATATQYFYTNFAPTGTPANVAAAANGPNRVDLSWTYDGNEPDRAGFEITESHGSSSRVVTAPASSCSGSSCAFSLSGYPTPAVGTSEYYSYTVTALRRSGGCGGCGDYTRSASSPSAQAQLDGPPQPPPSPTPTPTPTDGSTGGTSGSTTGGSTGTTTGSSTGGTSGSTSGGSTGATSGSTSGTSTGGTSTGGTTGSAAKPITIPTLPPLAASRRAFALGFNRFSPSLGIPKLPPLPATSFPVTAPSEEGYQPTLPYDAEKRTTTKVLSSPIASITEGIDSEKLAEMLAMALILLVAAAHVRVFLSHSAED